MARFGPPDFRPLRWLGAASLSLACAGITSVVCGIRINTSSSIPLGLYVATGDSTAELIEFCPTEPFASQSSERGYRTPGTACPDWAVPLLKPIVAVDGDLVTVSPDGISVNGRSLPKTAPLKFDRVGRPLQPWPFGQYRVVPGQVWVASTYSRGSYDSRYMGPIQIRQIRRRLRPLWLING